ncbi:MAG: hypothetical protein J0L62_17505 [Bacteroidetes bacterium]|nr:hypothetical protein [Bacteroidota bacterium]
MKWQSLEELIIDQNLEDFIWNRVVLFFKIETYMTSIFNLLDLKLSRMVENGIFRSKPEIKKYELCNDGEGIKITMADGFLDNFVFRYHPNTGLFETHGGIGKIYEKILKENQINLGYPISDEINFSETIPFDQAGQVSSLARVSYFQYGRIEYKTGIKDFKVFDHDNNIIQSF